MNCAKMLRDDKDRNHRITINYVLSIIPETEKADRDRVLQAAEAHIKAKTAFDTKNSDDSMVNLIGTWARFSRMLWEMDDKYGRKE